MKEFMFLVRAKGNPIAGLSFNEQQKHIKKVGEFIQRLDDEGVLLSAQPFEDQGIILSNEGGDFHEGDFREGEEIIAGYYHIKMETLEKALSVARTDPRFDDSNWRLEIRPIMTLEGINL